MSMFALFANPVWEFVYPHFELEKNNLIAACHSIKNIDSKGVHKSNFGGSYQSPHNILENNSFSKVRNFINTSLRKSCDDLSIDNHELIILNSWINMNTSRSAINVDHTHSGVFSGVFYIKSPFDSGSLSFRNEGTNLLWEGHNYINQPNIYSVTNIDFTPVEGCLLIFPSFIPHSVKPNNHDDERISLSFNFGNMKNKL